MGHERVHQRHNLQSFAETHRVRENATDAGVVWVVMVVVGGGGCRMVVAVGGRL